MNVTTEVKYDLIVPRSIIPLERKDWHQIGLIVREEIGKGIMEQVDVNGRSYPNLKPSTVASKKGTVTGRGGKSGLKKRGGYKTGARTSAYPTKRLIDTGNLLESSYPRATNSQAEVRLGPQRSEIGRYQQEGIRPHKITAKGEALAFITEDGQVFRKSVQHPGTPPVPFFGISERCAKRILEFVGIMVDKWLKDVK